MLGVMSKKLHRDHKHAIIAGVCAGLGGHLGFSRFRVRIVFILLALMGAFGVALYIILWFLMPSDAPKISYN